MSQRLQILHLYRRLLRSAERYPSIKRKAIYGAIQEEFRENASLDPNDEKAKSEIALAHEGLGQLNQFVEEELTGGEKSGHSWTVTLSQNPMPRPEIKK